MPTTDELEKALEDLKSAKDAHRSSGTEKARAAKHKAAERVRELREAQRSWPEEAK